jgi:hypothetical protein
MPDLERVKEELKRTCLADPSTALQARVSPSSH